VSLTIRAATPQDAESVAALGREFVAYLQALGDPHPHCLSAEEYLRDGFGENPGFSGLIAELDGQVVGYMIYCRMYDNDLGGRMLYVVDLFVRESARRRGVARALMQEATNICQQGGGHGLLWCVYAPNKTAIAFYENLGAKHFQTLKFMHRSV
jgi:GNAT superfamily N-acetyltransferase